MNDQICHHVAEANLRDTIEMMLFVFIGWGIAPQRTRTSESRCNLRERVGNTINISFEGGSICKEGMGAVEEVLFKSSLNRCVRPVKRRCDLRQRAEQKDRG